MQGRKKQTIVGVVSIVGLLALVLIVTFMSPAEKAPQAPPPPPPTRLEAYWDAIVSICPAPPRGPKTAPYSLVEFGDFQCPHCGKAREAIENAVNTSGGKVNLYYVQTPFPQHKFAEPAAEAAIFAAKHGKFWEMYDMLYDHQDDLEPGNYDTYAAKVGLDGGALEQSVEGHVYQSDVTRSSQLADMVGVEETPLVALHDNKTGKVLWAVQGDKDANAQLAKTNWLAPQPATPVATASTPSKS